MSDVASLRREQSNYYRQQERLQSEIKANEQKIRRLESAKRAVESVKKDVKALRNEMKKKPDEYAAEWKGDQFTNYEGLSDSGVYGGLKQYHNNVDAVLDAICDEIYHLNAVNREYWGILGDIANALCWIGNEIEKLLN